jgi:hypothetical protein
VAGLEATWGTSFCSGFRPPLARRLKLGRFFLRFFISITPRKFNRYERSGTWFDVYFIVDQNSRFCAPRQVYRLSRSARVRTVPDSVTSFLAASAFTPRSADSNCGSFSSFAQTACSKSESLSCVDYDSYACRIVRRDRIMRKAH